jgi:hypothetical protein
MSEVIDVGRSPIPVVVGFDVPRRQRRLTVAFRIVLMIPHFVVLAIFGILLEIGVFIAWFVALILGRIPKGAQDFFARTIQYFTRVYAYGYLLTDRYPPFGLSRREYPLSVEISSGRLNRLAVLFRLILQIPAFIVMQLVVGGLNVAMVFVWLIVLVAGTMPATLYQAIAAILRYQTRFAAYITLANATYPAGLFGDPAEPMLPVEPHAHVAAAPVEQGIEQPVDVGEAQLPVPTQPPLATTLRLTKPAKRLVALFIALGLIWTAGYFAIIAVVGPRVNASSDLDDAYAPLSRATKEFQIASAACNQSRDIECEKDALRKIAAAMNRFAADVRAIDFPSDAVADAQQLETDTDAFGHLLKEAASASTDSEFNGFMSQIPDIGTRFDDDLNRLHDDLI